MREKLTRVLEAAQKAGGDYADVRFVEDREESLMVRDGALRQFRRASTRGVGIRVLAKGSWGFASTADLGDEALSACARLAVEIALAGARVNPRPIEPAPNPAHRDRYRSSYGKDPFEVSAREKIERLMDAEATLKAVRGVSIAQATMDFLRRYQLFLSTEGADIEQEFLESGVGAEATAIGQNDVQTRSYPNSFRGQFESRGYELVDEYLIEDELKRIAGESVALLDAPQCPPGVMDVVIGSSQMALQVHESCGHAVEFDRILGQERNFAGESFIRPGDIGALRYGNERVNIYSSAIEPRALGSFGYDDEGVAAGRFDLVRKGRLVGVLTSRDTAPVLGQTSNGCMRADGWSAVPIIRMTNISLEPGDQSFEDLIGGVDRGIYMETNRTWSIDNYRLNFQFGCELGYEIRGGKLGRMVKNPQYTAMTTEFWNSCTGIGRPELWKVWGIPGCGKGQPMQTAHVSHGSAPVRFANVKVGVGYAES
jgi:TldD protein